MKCSTCFGLATFLVLAASLTPCQASLQFAETAKLHLPLALSPTHRPTFVVPVDVDGNGGIDLVSGGSNPVVINRLWLNDRAGIFRDDTAGRLPLVDGYTTLTMAAANVDGDHAPDLFVCPAQASPQPVRLWRNDGKGRFLDETASRMPIFLQAFSVGALAVLDVEGDGDLDCVAGFYTNQPVVASPLVLLRNDGKGRFTVADAFPAGRFFVTTIVAGDVDADGDGDLLVCAFDAADQSRLYLNDGKGVFSDASSRLPTRKVTPASLALADLDGDRDLDVFVGRAALDAQTAAPNELWINDGKGTFTEQSAMRLPPDADYTFTVTAGDVDGDGDLDLVAGNQPWGTVSGQDRLYLNDGSGHFRDATARGLPADNDVAYDVRLVDVDSDGNLDLMTANSGFYVAGGGGLALHYGDGQGVFRSAVALPALPAHPDPLVASTFVETDGDGNLDLVLAANGQSRLWLGDGLGSFRDVTDSHLPRLLASARALAVGDVDGDRDVDVVLGVERSRDLLWLNDGKGRFTDVSALRLPPDTDDALGVALGDVDKDGDLDLVIANFRTPSRIYLNDGKGSFQDATAARLPNAVHVVRALALVDVERDGDLDLVFANLGRNALYRNDGRGFFTDASADLPAVELESLALAVGDVDEDGDPDLVIGTDWLTVVHVNDGRGRFVDAPQSPLLRTNNPRAVALVDADHDGDLDLVVGLPGSFFVNDGHAAFTGAPERMPSAISASTLAMGDADHDGDVDLFVGSALVQLAPASRLLLNRHRSLTTPYWPRPGRPWLLDVQSRPGYAAGLQLVVPFFAPALARPLDHPLFGRFHLDPSLMAIGLIDAIPAPSGQKTLGFTLPAMPELAGRSLAAQALVLSSLTDPRLWRLTNVVHETVR